MHIVCNVYKLVCLFGFHIASCKCVWDSNPALTKTLLDLGTPLDELLTGDST